MVAHEVTITEPADPQARRFEPRSLRFRAAVPSQRLAIDEAKALWRREFGAIPGPGTNLACREFDQLPRELASSAGSNRPQMHLVIEHNGGRYVASGDWVRVSRI